MRKAIVTLIAALALSSALSLRPASAEKWALMIGINEYEHERIPDLRGCENDVKLLRTVLIQNHGFPEKNIRTLFSRDATRQRIVEEFENWLIKQAKPGDVVLFHFSGHGSQVRSLDPHEKTGLDQTICPTNLRVGSAGADIRDNELAGLINRLRASHITIILDACHSGTGTRDLDGALAPTSVPVDAQGQRMTTRVRYAYREELVGDIPAVLTVPAGFGTLFGDVGRPGAGTRSLQGEVTRSVLGPHATVVLPQQGITPHTLISGSKPEQTAADAPFPVGREYRFFGALSYNLAGALMQADPRDPNWTYSRVVEKAIQGIKRRGFKQDPQLEHIGTAPTKRLFQAAPAIAAAPVAPAPAPSRPFVLVNSAGGNLVELAAGSAAGVTEQSVYTIYEPDDHKLEGPGIALAQVQQVGATTSVAVLKRAEPGRLRRGSRAVETLRHYPPNRLYVAVDGPQKPALEAALRNIPFVGVVTRPGDYMDRILRAQAEGATLKGWLVNAEGRRLPPHTAASPAALVEALRPDLTNAFVIKRLSLLHNPAPPFQVKVWVDGQPERMEGENIVFRFRADRDCYLNLINAGTSGKVTVLFPNAFHRDNRVRAGREYSIPSADMHFDIQAQGPPGLELVKAIATEAELNLLGFDFTQLVSDKPFLTRSLAESAGDPLRMESVMSRALGAALAKNRSRDFRVVARLAAPTTPPAVPAPPVSVQTIAQPPKLSVVAPSAPVKVPTPAQQQPIVVTPDPIPTGGWATDSMIVTVRGRGVEE